MTSVLKFISKHKYVFLIVSLILTIILLFFYIRYTVKLDSEFVDLIKDMAIKNHNDTSLFVNKFTTATTTEEKQKTILINQFYDCVYNNSYSLRTKNDINAWCGHIIKF